MEIRKTPVTKEINQKERIGEFFAALEKVTSERDEAREERDIARLEFEEISNDLNDARKERDEAREQIKNLIYIAERAIDLAEIDFENDKFGIVSELRSDLEKIKEETK